MKNNNYIIHKNVTIGRNARIGDFVIIGVLPTDKKESRVNTIIGAGAILRAHSVIYAGNRIGDNFQIGHNVIIRENNFINDDVSIGSASTVEHHCRIGNKVRIHSQTFICEYSVLEEGSWIGPGVVFTNTLHPLCPKAKKCLKGPCIKKNAKIGGNVTILPDVTIGENALVGAGSVVINDIPKNTVAIGNPARVIKNIDELKCRYGLIKKPYEYER